MFGLHLSAVSPWWLLLLAAVPLLWWYSWRKLRLMGPVRRTFAIGLRSLVIVLLVAALAELQTVRISDKLTAIYLLDQSLSIPEARRRAMIDYVNAETAKHIKLGDRAGVIVFGRDSAIEVPPFDEALRMTAQVESLIDPEYTNMAAAMKLAQASFPEDAAKRIVIISDGNENLGNALEQAEAAASTGIGIDSMPVQYHTRAEVVVERVAVPEEVRRGQPFDLRVVVNNTAEATPRDNGEVRGRLIVSRTADGQPSVLSDEAVTLLPGKRVFALRQQIDETNFYTYDARFVPNRPEDDRMPQNNRATAFSHVGGKGHVLLIENEESPGEHAILAERLRKMDLDVTLKKSSVAFASLTELQAFDTVVLGNVPKDQLTEDQIAMLKTNTQQMGAGLVMLGGEHSFGAGGWTGTDLEEVMPVDFQIKSAKVVPRGALVMIMHASETPDGNHWQKVIAEEAIKTLGGQDYCGLLHWNGNEQWLWGKGLSKVADNRATMLRRVATMVPGDMPAFDGTMQMAVKGFSAVKDAAVRHMIIISDGDPTPPSAASKRALKNLNVTVSTVAVGAHGPAESRTLSEIAADLGGKYYQVTNNKALPRIFQREARRVARPLIWNERPFSPQIVYRHDLVGSAQNPLPPIKAFVLTSRKESSLVERVITAPVVNEDNNTILAGWTFGLGKAVAFTTDAGATWASGWIKDAAYDVLPQMIRWSMRPAGGDDKFSVVTDYVDGKARIVVNALSGKDEFLNFLNLTGVVVGPDLKSIPVKLEQVAPGRYEASLPAKDAGSYLINIAGMRPKEGGGPGPKFSVVSIRSGINVPYSDEFRDRTPNETLMTQLAAIEPKGGAVGTVIRAGDGGDKLEGLLVFNTFRHDLPKAHSSQDIWHYLVLAACCLFLGDVFVRRVHVDFGWVSVLYVRMRDKILGRDAAPVKVELIDRLRSRKAEVAGQIEQMRSTARFEPTAAKGAPPAMLNEIEPPPVAMKPPEPPPLSQQKREEESYTERLLKAKKQARDDRKE